MPGIQEIVAAIAGRNGVRHGVSIARRAPSPGSTRVCMRHCAAANLRIGGLNTLVNRFRPSPMCEVGVQASRSGWMRTAATESLL